jgi:hypothetical protein
VVVLGTHLLVELVVLVVEQVVLLEQPEATPVEVVEVLRLLVELVVQTLQATTAQLVLL